MSTRPSFRSTAAGSQQPPPDGFTGWPSRQVVPSSSEIRQKAVSSVSHSTRIRPVFRRRCVPGRRLDLPLLAGELPGRAEGPALVLRRPQHDAAVGRLGASGLDVLLQVDTRGRRFSDAGS